MAQSLGEFEQLLLVAIVRLDKGAYGASLRREIEQRTGRTVAIGAIYTALDRLEQKGFVASRMGKPTAERGGRRKRFYRLETLGSKTLGRSYQSFKQMVAGLGKKLEAM